MPERWTEIKQVDDSIYANRHGKKRTQDEIELLQDKLKNYDIENMIHCARINNSWERKFMEVLL